MKSKIGPKQGRTSLAVLIVLIFSLVSLAWIQLSLNENASQSQARTIKQNLRAASFNFINDFNRELGIFRDILNQYLSDKMRESTEGMQIAAANLAFDFYQKYTRYPKLVKEIFLLKNNALIQRVIYRESNGDRVEFVDEDLFESDNVLVDHLEVWQVQENTGKIVDSAQAKKIIDTCNQTYVIENNEMTANFIVFLTPGSRLQIVFNLDVLKNNLLKTLSDKYFSPEGILKDFVISLSYANDSQLLFKSKNLDISHFESELTIPILLNHNYFEGGQQFERIPNIEFWINETNVGARDRRFEPGRHGFVNLNIYHSMGSLELALSLNKIYNTIFSILLLVILLTGLLYLYLLFSRHRLMIQSQHNFISSVSHEIKTPISVLKAAAENLKEGIVQDPEATMRYGERMLIESDRLLNLTENVLRYANLDSMQGLDKSIFQDINFAELLVSRVRYWAVEFVSQSALLEYLPSTDVFLVRGDQGALSALVDNLLSNALKHGINGGQERRVLMSLSNKSAIDTKYDSGDRVIFSIKDFGAGIAKKYQKLIFEPFYRPPKTSSNGVGLGLSLVKKIAISHQGQVLVQSTLGSGTLFEIQLPRRVP